MSSGAICPAAPVGPQESGRGDDGELVFAPHIGATVADVRHAKLVADYHGHGYGRAKVGVALLGEVGYAAIGLHHGLLEGMSDRLQVDPHGVAGRSGPSNTPFTMEPIVRTAIDEATSPLWWPPIPSAMT